MKLPKTRIKIVTTRDGVLYYPQVKCHWLIDLSGWTGILKDSYTTDEYHLYEYPDVYFDYRSEKDAEKVIDNYLSYLKEEFLKEEKRKARRTILSTSYRTYP